MSLHLWPTSLLMGQNEDVPDSTWYENDGVVNSVSMSHPVGSRVVKFTGNPIAGIWQTMERLNMDHQAIIGHGVSKKEHENLFVLYKNHCLRLYQLQ